MGNDRRYIQDGVRVACAYVGTVIGAGFASGQEIMQFFTKYGYASFGAVMLTTLLFIVIGRRILLLGARWKAASYRGFVDHVFGVLSPFVNLYLAIAYILLCGAMFAGGGALFSEHWGLPYLVGALLTAGPTLLVTLYGVKGILTANTLIVPSIVLFSVIILLYVLQQSFAPVVSLAPQPDSWGSLVRSGITYASFNLILSIGVMAPMGGVVRDRRSLYLGSILGGALLGGMLLIGNYSLLQYIPEVFHKEIPLLYIVQRMGQGFVWIYGLVLWAGIFTTAIGNLYAISSMLQDTLRIKPYIPAVVVTGAGLVICGLGFSTIVSWFYPLLGMIGFVLIGMIMLQR